MIGVIAKVGDILQGSRAEVQKQIDEALTTRKAGANNQEIRLDVLWIVTTGKIGKNVRDVLRETNPGRNLIYLDGDILAQKITEKIPEFWKDIPFEIASRLKVTATQVLLLDREFDLIQNNDDRFYVNQRVTKKDFEVRSRKKWKQKEKDVNFIDECISKRLTLLEGEFGYGKSKLLRHAALELSKDENFIKHEIFPHYIPFWKLVETFGSDFSEYLSSVNQSENLSNKKDAHIFFLDGFDETSKGEDDQIKSLQLICTAAESSDVRVVVSSRPLSETTRAHFNNLNFRCLELSPLSLNQLLKFVKFICEKFNQDARLVADIKDSPLIQQLPKSPISAILLAQLLAQTDQDLPTTLPELYSKYMELMLGRWDIEKGLQNDREYKAANGILPQIAEYFVENSLTSISEAEIRGFFTDYLAERPLDVDADSLFEKSISRSGILVRNPLDNTVTFKHPTFTEFLYARRKSESKGLKIDDRALSFGWNTIFYFYFGLKPDCPELLTDLDKLIPKSPIERWGMIYFFPSYLLAASATPYSASQPLFNKAITEFVSVYSDISQGRIESPFQNLTKMEFLSICVAVFKARYGFAFFNRAMEDFSLELEKHFSDSSSRAIAAFFIGFARLGTDDPKLYDFILEQEQDYLPGEMKIVMDYESQKNGCKSKLTRKFHRRISKEFRGTNAGKNLATSIFERRMGGPKIEVDDV